MDLPKRNSEQSEVLIEIMGGEQPNPLPGYRHKIVDGTCLAATDHRLDAIRLFAAKALPGKAIVVLDPLSKLVIDIILCQDGHGVLHVKILPAFVWLICHRSRVLVLIRLAEF
jgi:hypothetical protein